MANEKNMFLLPKIALRDCWIFGVHMSQGPLAIFGGFYLKRNNGISFLKARLEFLISNIGIGALCGFGLH